MIFCHFSFFLVACESSEVFFMPYLRCVNVKLVLNIKVLLCNLKFCFIFAVSKETR